MKAIEWYFRLVMFIILLHHIVLNFECVDEILMCDHSKERYLAELCCGAVYCAVQSGCNF